MTLNNNKTRLTVLSHDNSPDRWHLNRLCACLFCVALIGALAILQILLERLLIFRVLAIEVGLTASVTTDRIKRASVLNHHAGLAVLCNSNVPNYRHLNRLCARLLCVALIGALAILQILLERLRIFRVLAIEIGLAASVAADRIKRTR